MENTWENSCPKTLYPLEGQYPWLFFQHGEEYEKQTFYNIFDPEKNKQVKKCIPHLQGKTIIPCYHGWLFLYGDENDVLDGEGEINEEEEPLDGDGEIEEQQQQQEQFDGDGEVEEEEMKVTCCLWNPVTLESIPLPSLLLKSEDVIKSCILSSSPVDNPDSFLLLFIRSSSPYLVMFCKVGDQEWTELNTAELHHGIQMEFPDFFIDPICCNGKIYARNMYKNYLVEIDPNLAQNEDNRKLVLRIHQKAPSVLSHSNLHLTYLVESRGEVFQIIFSVAAKSHTDISGVEVFKFDFSNMEWKKVKSFKDRVFFVDTFKSYCCLVMDVKTQGNCIYFLLSNDRSIYCFDMEEKSVSISLPDVTLEPTWKTPIWLMADFKFVAVNKQRTRKSDDNEVVVIEKTQNQLEVGDVCKLQLDLLPNIVSCLGLYDYMNFRAVNKCFRIATAVVPFTTCCLMVCKNGEDTCSFVDPLHPGKYQLYNPHKSDEVRVCFIKEGWCLMAQGEYTVFFWNPFTHKIIQLPKPPHPCIAINGATFSASPESSDCVIILISQWPDYFIDSFSMEEGEWYTETAISEEDDERWYGGLGCNNNPVIYDAQIFWLDPEGYLGVFGDEYFKYDIAPPVESESIHESYLLEGNGKLTCVLVGLKGKWVRVFEFDLSSKVWVELDNIGDLTFYVSPISSFSVVVRTEELKNKIFFPVMRGNNTIYYCLSTRKYYLYGTDNVNENFYNTKIQLYCAWIEPRWS